MNSTTTQELKAFGLEENTVEFCTPDFEDHTDPRGAFMAQYEQETAKASPLEWALRKAQKTTPLDIMSRGWTSARDGALNILLALVWGEKAVISQQEFDEIPLRDSCRKAFVAINLGEEEYLWVDAFLVKEKFDYVGPFIEMALTPYGFSHESLPQFGRFLDHFSSSFSGTSALDLDTVKKIYALGIAHYAL